MWIVEICKVDSNDNSSMVIDVTNNGINFCYLYEIKFKNKIFVI